MVRGVHFLVFEVAFSLICMLTHIIDLDSGATRDVKYSNDFNL